MANILFLDIEKAPKIVATYDMFDTSIPLYHLIQDSFVVSIAWSWNEEEKIHHVSVMDDVKRFIKDHTDDYYVIKKIHEELKKADVIVGHYIKGFDWKEIMGQVVLHKLPPLRKPRIVDTLTEAKRYNYTSKKLDFLAKKLGYGGKIEHRKEMMLGCAQGDVKSLRECIRYNKGDIEPMRNLYYRFRPYTHTTQYPNETDGKRCPFCKSNKIQKRGKTCGRIRFHCTMCYKWSSIELEKLK